MQACSAVTTAPRSRRRGPPAARRALPAGQKLGVSALDGETSALFVLASILGMHAASLAYLAENYATGAAAPMDAQARGRLFTAAAEALRCC